MIDYNDDGLWAVAKTTDAFGGKFLKAVATENPGNLITSPLSAQVVLAMVAYGAGGTTAEQMRSALLIPTDDEFGLNGYKSLMKGINTAKGVELRLANKIYTSTKAPVKDDYIELTRTKFLSSIQEVNFNDAQSTADTINSWCKEQTNNRIKDLIDPGSITPDSVLILVNAVYFKGQWKKKFNIQFTNDKSFHLNESTTIDVPTMFIESNLRFGEVPELHARFVEIPYQVRGRCKLFFDGLSPDTLNSKLVMLIVLPNEINGLEMILDNIDNESIQESLQQARYKDVELFLSEFKINSSLDLNTVLQSLGMKEMFAHSADFSGISEAPLKVSKVLQKAFIEVNEEGSEAAAATGDQLIAEGEICDDDPSPVSFIVDRPFYYAIREPLIGTSLFTGVVHQPIVQSD